MYEHGWFQIAFERELGAGESLTPLRLFKKPLVAVREAAGAPVRIFAATCPHRGADLSCGSKLLPGGALRCAFHGMKIGLGACSEDGFAVREYKTLIKGGMVFVRLSEREDPAFEGALDELMADHQLVPGFSMEVNTALEVVSENGWDPTHFKAVHGLPYAPRFSTEYGSRGELVSDGKFIIKRSGWYESGSPGKGDLESGFRAHAYSPGLVIAHLRGSPPFNYTVITGATSHEEAERCTIRVTIAIPGSVTLGEKFLESLMVVSKRGLDEDNLIWSHLDLDARSNLLPSDELFRVFAEFCRKFGEPRDRRLG